MSVAVPRSQIVRLDFDLDAAVKTYTAMLGQHKLSTNTPAPTAHPVVDYIVRSGGGAYTILEDVPQEQLDVYAKLKSSGTLTARFADFGSARVIVSLDGADVAAFSSVTDMQQIVGRAVAVGPPHYQRAQWGDADETQLLVTIDGVTMPVPQTLRAAVLNHLRMVNIDVAAYVASPPEVPTSITRRQLLIAAMQDGFITPDHAVSAAQTGMVPPEIKATFDALPYEQRYAAYITWASVANVYRTDPLTLAVARALNLSDAQIDAFFIQAAQL